jgi:hypothetical protein
MGSAYVSCLMIVVATIAIITKATNDVKTSLFFVNKSSTTVMPIKVSKNRCSVNYTDFVYDAMVLVILELFQNKGLDHDGIK